MLNGKKKKKTLLVSHRYTLYIATKIWLSSNKDYKIIQKHNQENDISVKYIQYLSIWIKNQI